MMCKGKKFFGTILTVILGAVLFACYPVLSYAQYTQVNTYGGAYTYVDNYSRLDITTTDATAITSFSATLNGLVNDYNLYNTQNLSTWFEYGTNTSLGYSTIHSTPNTGYANFSSNIGNLSPNTYYYFRAVGQTPRGVVYGITNSFRTNFANVNNNNNPPASTPTTNPKTATSVKSAKPATPNVITNSASAISRNGAKMNALIINPSSDALTWFEWGTTSSLGNRTETVATGAFPSLKYVNTITGLEPGTVYYFRAVLENSSGKIMSGATLSFTTTSPASNQNNVEEEDMTGPAPAPGSTLAANVLGSGSFLPENMLGWSILIILTLILLMLIKYLYNNYLANKKTEARTKTRIKIHDII